MPTDRLVLFDIDGTLLNGGRLWREVFEAAFIAVFPGQRFPSVSFSGKTDRQICAEVLAAIRWRERAGLAGERERLIDQLIQSYLVELARNVHNGRAQAEVEVFDGARALLDSLAAEASVQLGLLTGNVREGAWLKLSAVGLESYFGSKSEAATPRFKAGAFGDDHADRYQLPAIAVDRAKQELGREFRGKQVVIIGDTPHDVNCGKSIGVCSIAMGTGRVEYREALLAAGPDHYFENFANATGLLKAILGLPKSR